MINADQDAMASALALKRIMHNRIHNVEIMRINEVTRPDNLDMIQHLRITVKPWTPKRSESFNRFAIVDSQPYHNKLFDNIPFTLVIDHHPLHAENTARHAEDVYSLIRPNSTPQAIS
ncbi:MAG: hypothetical protein LBS77_07630 [Desulfovibrio sp.]|jgi:nanoRNase/pAp phosphatase (c-di-AMP/oligoRNAs hydrolase)|nr:hypothetical protein [Desulfovibrio sp.]